MKCLLTFIFVWISLQAYCDINGNDSVAEVYPKACVTETHTDTDTVFNVELPDIYVVRQQRMQTATTEIIFLTDSIRKSAANAAMMIGNLPGFKVDWITEDISIGNDRNIPIIVNGQEMGLQYAKSINPKRIKSIEVQRYPPGLRAIDILHPGKLSHIFRSS